MTTIKRDYRLEIISRGTAVDTGSDPAGRKIYTIETWTFRLLDGASLADYAHSEPRPFANWEEDYTDQAAWEADQARRTALRQDWDQRILTLLTGRPVPETEINGWAISRLFADVFAAARIRRAA